MDNLATNGPPEAATSLSFYYRSLRVPQQRTPALT